MTNSGGERRSRGTRIVPSEHGWNMPQVRGGGSNHTTDIRIVFLLSQKTFSKGVGASGIKMISCDRSIPSISLVCGIEVPFFGPHPQQQDLDEYDLPVIMMFGRESFAVSTP